MNSSNRLQINNYHYHIETLLNGHTLNMTFLEEKSPRPTREAEPLNGALFCPLSKFGCRTLDAWHIVSMSSLKHAPNHWQCHMLA